MRRKWCKCALIGIYILLLLVLFAFSIPKLEKEKPPQIFKLQTWTQKNADGSVRSVQLPRKTREKTQGYVEISLQLSQDFQKRQSIAFWSYDQRVQVYLDGEILYDSGQEWVSQWNFVNLPDQVQGSCLKIRYSGPNDSMKVDTVIYGSIGEIQRWFRKTYDGGMLLDFLFVGLGIAFMVSSILSKIDYRYKKCQFLYGAMAVLFGLWLDGATKGNSFLNIDAAVRNLLGYLAFFLIPPALTAYVKIRVMRVKLFVYISNSMMLVQAVAVAVFFGLHVLQIRDIRQDMIYVEGFLLLSVLWAMFVSWYYYIRLRSRISIFTVLSGCVLLCAAGLEILWNHELERIGEHGIAFRICLMVIVLLEFTVFYAQLKQKQRMQEEIKAQNQKLQLHILTSQIKPHFILNTLGAIRNSIRQDPDQAYDLLYDFSIYIRKNMEEKDYTKPIPFLEELDYIKTYLKLQKLRFGDRLEVVYDIQYPEFWILPLTIQPFVENAVKHGIMEMRDGGTVWIRTRRKRDRIEIVVEDNGVGFDVSQMENQQKEGKSLGMRSAMYRLKYEMNGVCRIESSRKSGKSGTCVTIELPVKNSEVIRGENHNRR